MTGPRPDDYPDGTVHGTFRAERPSRRGLRGLVSRSRRHAPDAWEPLLSATLSRVRPDVISIHNIHGARWPAEIIARCDQAAPVVWTLHDMWAFTGSCAYSYDCRLFVDAECDGSCPQLGVYPVVEPERIRSEVQEKRSVLQRTSNATLVAPSRWLAEEARSAVGEWVPVLSLSNGADTRVFRPIPKDEARCLLGIDSGARIALLTVAESHRDPRKGLDLLLGALETLKETSFKLLTMGKRPKEDLSVPSNVDLVSLGSIPEQPRQAMAYSAADLFVHPSRMDNQPLVIQEAMACGLPVVAFSVGGTSEMVDNGRTGWLADSVASDSLARQLQKAVDGSDRFQEMGEAGRRFAESHYSLERFAQRYRFLFERLIEGGKVMQEEIDAIGESIS
jgi:glycosyltransferase involved in cell wall biosynthesis